MTSHLDNSSSLLQPVNQHQLPVRKGSWFKKLTKKQSKMNEDTADEEEPRSLPALPPSIGSSRASVDISENVGSSPNTASASASASASTSTSTSTSSHHHHHHHHSHSHNHNHNHEKDGNHIVRSASVSESSSSSSRKGSVVYACRCCGTLITYPADISKVKCSMCSTVFIFKKSSNDSSISSSKNIEELSPSPLSYSALKYAIEECKKSLNPQATSHSIFKPLEEYLYRSFSSYDCLNYSFRNQKSETKLSYSSSGLDQVQLKKFYKLLLSLPSKRPFYALLCASNDLLLRPTKFSEPAETYWLLILLEIPTLRTSLLLKDNSYSQEIKSVSYEILKRVIGFLGYSDKKTKQYLCHWFSRLTPDEFTEKVNLINLYINFQLNRCISLELKNNPANNYNSSAHLTDADDNPGFKDDRPSSSQSGNSSYRLWNFSTINGKQKQNNEIKIKLYRYGNDWHLRTAGRFMAILFSSNIYYNTGKQKIPCSTFYNTLVDYVSIKQDFDAWQFNCGAYNKGLETNENGDASVQSVINYLHSASTTSIYGIGSPLSPTSTRMKPTFTFCQYPCLISLGAKISVLEYEAKRQMERKAEEAFISSISRKVPIDVNFKIRVRREHISNDSLRCIQQHPNDLRKSLRVEFINEPGIDAGGLKKEWFLLLSKELFNPDKGLFTYNETSCLGWFSISPIENDEMYYLVGVVLGLAIYNSTILDLQFPRAFYKKLLGNTNVGLDDFIELYPEAGKNLKKILHYHKNDDLKSLELYFEVTFRDIFGAIHTRELIPNGSKIQVTFENKIEYINKYLLFYLDEIIKTQADAFKRGFDQVIGGNALSLFTAEEIELILIGDDSKFGDKFLNVDILKVVSKYQGGLTENSKLVLWFWEYVETLNYKQQKKLLLFITGSDRLPATGIQSLNFKITLLNGSKSRFPVAHTCFNELCIYNYDLKQDFYNKLDFAVNESEGFGIK
ncbi:hypothetical protein PACTADRAFT_48527 [Pachysolen tannophilus NRRL Y-2460]|uniref:HECT-type E3 ubiquitin transferase n=1 Tax=Pachysolen tannophilus NRRL Y-2460 TaxID=669874 RepID=A0A1E4TY82_PACTA|nr:hypothetical protein PACTADRAFT_48527 [Pachysolen tannophilus NRRL Y-2460]